MNVTINLNVEDIKRTEVIDAVTAFLTATKEQLCADESKSDQKETLTSAEGSRTPLVGAGAPAPNVSATPTMPTPAPTVPVVPATVAPATPVPPVATVPTAAPQYTLEQLANAGATLVNAGKMGEVSAILAKYGVESLTSLNPSMYGAVALDLRSLGAQI